MVIWNPKTTLQFIQLVEKRELLWNPDHKDYNNNAKTWKAIEKMMKISTKNLKYKLNQLKKQYRKNRNLPNSKKWYAYKPLDKFLKKLPWPENNTSTSDPMKTSTIENYLLTGNIKGKTPKPHVNQDKSGPGISEKST